MIGKTTAILKRRRVLRQGVNLNTAIFLFIQSTNVTVREGCPNSLSPKGAELLEACCNIIESCELVSFCTLFWFNTCTSADSRKFGHQISHCTNGHECRCIITQPKIEFIPLVQMFLYFRVYLKFTIFACLQTRKLVNLLVRFVKFHDFFFKFCSLIGCEAKFSQVVCWIFWFLRIEVSKFWLNQVRTEQGMSDKRTRQPEK